MSRAPANLGARSGSAVMAARSAASNRIGMRTLNVAICRLRHKVLQTGTRLPLHTVHGVGYVFLGNLREVSSR